MRPVTAIFDIGRTNKKFFLFDASFREVHREYISFAMIEDEDGCPTEDLDALRQWMLEVVQRMMDSTKYEIRALNFSAYGASFVHLDAEGKVLTPLYNYEKPAEIAVKNRLTLYFQLEKISGANLVKFST